MAKRRAARPGLLLFVLPALFDAAPAGPADLAEIKRAKRLVVAASAAELPFEGEVLDGFARALGVELRVEVVAGSALAALQEGRADLAAGGFVSQRDRRERIVFSAEVLPTRFVAVRRTPGAAPAHIEDLRNAGRILAPAATGAADVAQASKLPRFKTDVSLGTEKALAALRADSGSVAIVGLFEALVARRADPSLQLGVSMGDRQSIAFALREADADLRLALDVHVGRLRSSPSYGSILARALGADALAILARAHLQDAR